MNFKNLSEEAKNQIKVFTYSGCFIVLFLTIIRYLPRILSLLGKLWGASAPFVFGFCFAFILKPLRNWVENDALKNQKMSERTKRKLGVLACVIVFIGALMMFAAILFPQILSSFGTLANSMDDYMNTFRKLIENINGQDNPLSDFMLNIVNTLGEHAGSWLTGAQGGIEKIISYSVSFVSTVFNFFIGIIVAVYFLLDEEKFRDQFRKILYALVSKPYADGVLEVSKLTGQMFNRFIFGKALDSLIIGLICWIVISIMRLPYSTLIAFVIGITNMIPVFGPFIGAIPCLFILLMINPVYALEFAVVILVLQQIDGNILGPYILGDSMGLPTLWIMFAIIVGGALFGIIGMFVGVPIFSVIYFMAKQFVQQRLEEKNLEV